MEEGGERERKKEDNIWSPNKKDNPSLTNEYDIHTSIVEALRSMIL